MPDVPLPYPIGGLSDNFAHDAQPPRTTRDAQNERSVDPKSNRIRGGQRAGFSRFSETALAAGAVRSAVQVTFDARQTDYTNATTSAVGDLSEWTAALNSGEGVPAIVHDSQGNKYAIDGKATIVKLNRDGVRVYTFTLPVRDEAQKVRALAIDVGDNLYVGVSEGGDQSKAWLRRYAPDTDKNLVLQWEIVTGEFVEQLVLRDDKLYAAVNDTSRKRSSWIQYENLSLGSGATVAFRRDGIPYPLNDLDVNFRGEVLTASGPRSPLANPLDKRYYDPTLPDHTAVFDAQRWDPTQLPEWDRRKWAWFVAEDLESEDGSDVEVWPDTRGRGLCVFERDVSTPSGATAFVAPKYRSRGLGGKPAVQFSGSYNRMVSPPSVNDSAGVNDIQPTLFPNRRGHLIVMVVQFGADATQRGQLWSQANGAWSSGINAAYINCRSDTGLTGAAGAISIRHDERSSVAGETTDPISTGTSPNYVSGFVASAPQAAIVTLLVDANTCSDGFNASYFRVNGATVSKWLDKGQFTATGNRTILGSLTNGTFGPSVSISEFIVLRQYTDPEDGLEKVATVPDVNSTIDYGTADSTNVGDHDDTVSDTEVERIEGFLAWKYGISHLLDDGGRSGTTLPSGSEILWTGSAFTQPRALNLPDPTADSAADASLAVPVALQTGGADVDTTGVSFNAWVRVDTPGAFPSSFTSRRLARWVASNRGFEVTLKHKSELLFIVGPGTQTRRTTLEVDVAVYNGTSGTTYTSSDLKVDVLNTPANESAARQLWVMVTMAYRKSGSNGELRIYINGTNQFNGVIPTVMQSPGNSQAFTLGGSASASGLPMQIDEVEFLRTFLQPANVTPRFANGQGAFQTPNDTTIGLWHFDETVAPLGTSTDASTNANTVTLAGNAEVPAGVNGRVQPIGGGPVSRVLHPFTSRGTASGSTFAPPNPNGRDADTLDRDLLSNQPITAKWSPPRGAVRWVAAAGGMGYAVKAGATTDFFTVGPRRVLDDGTVSTTGTNAAAIRKLLDTGSSAAGRWAFELRDESNQPIDYPFEHPRIAVDKFDNVYVPGQFPSTYAPTRYSLYAFRSGGDVSSGLAVPFLRYQAGTAADGSIREALAVSIDPRIPDYTGNPTLIERPEFVALGVETTAPGQAAVHQVRLVNATPNNASARAVQYLGVVAGRLVKFGQGAVSTVSSTAFAASAKYIASVNAYGKAFFTDGVSYRYYEPRTGVVSRWTATDGGSIVPRYKLLTLWRGRMVLARGDDDPQNWQMSEAGNPFGWDFFPPDSPLATQAIIGNEAEIGRVPDAITAMIPYDRERLIFGCDHTIYIMWGDPMENGSIVLASDTTGMAFGSSWAKDAEGVLYFFGSRGGVYAMTPQAGVRKLTTESIDRRMQDIDFAAFFPTLVWDEDLRELRVFMCRRDTGTITAAHWAWCKRTNSWHQDKFSSVDVQPTCATVFDSDSPEDRVVVIGCEDGWVRKVDRNATSDDGRTIESWVTIGPFATDDGGVRLRDPRVTLADDQNGCWLEMASSTSPDARFVAQESTELQPGDNPTKRIGVRGNYAWVRLRNAAPSTRWAFERGTIGAYSAGRRVSPYG
jgi:hypothetical protein